MRTAAVRVGCLHRGGVNGGSPVSVTIYLSPAQTIEYPRGGGHFWVYLNWPLALCAAGCRVIWLEGVDLNDRANPRRQLRYDTHRPEHILSRKERFEWYGGPEAIALTPLYEEAVERDPVHR